jgi:hypothetical protein
VFFSSGIGAIVAGIVFGRKRKKNYREGREGTKRFSVHPDDSAVDPDWFF